MSSDITPGEPPTLVPSAHGRWLYLTAPRDGAYELWRLRVDDGRLERLTEGHHYISGWNAVPLADARGGMRVAYLRSTPTEPADLWRLDTSAKGIAAGPTRLTSFNADVLADIDLREPVERHVEVDGRDIQGWHIPGGDGARPLVLEIHGGPHTLYGWSPSWEFQILAAAGIGVFYANPRGSEGYGEAFNDANHRDWGDGPMRDVLAGVDALVADGLADPDRLGVTGGSYGGYLTNWIVGHDQRFRRDDVSLRERHGHPVHDGRHRRRRLGAVRVRGDALGGPRLLPRDLADRICRRDPDAAADPALGAGPADDDRPGRGAVHGPAVAPSARPPAARAGGDARADESGTPFRRVENLRIVEDWFGHFLVRGEARHADTSEGPRRPLTA